MPHLTAPFLARPCPAWPSQSPWRSCCRWATQYFTPTCLFCKPLKNILRFFCPSPHSKIQLVKNRYTTILIEHHQAESVQTRGFLLKTTALKTSEAHRLEPVSFKNGKETFPLCYNLLYSRLAILQTQRAKKFHQAVIFRLLLESRRRKPTRLPDDFSM